MSVLLILVLIPLAVVLVLTIAAVASSPPVSSVATDGPSGRDARGSQPHRSSRFSDLQASAAHEPPAVVAAGFQ
jgi:hypothetical protein